MLKVKLVIYIFGFGWFDSYIKSMTIDGFQEIGWKL